jgi:fumarylacetoacetate hydrolase (EC 3.7.1.2)
MKLVTHLASGNEHVALLIDDKLYNITDADLLMPDSMLEVLQTWDDTIPKLREMEVRIRKGQILENNYTNFHAARVLAPIPRPTSCRDGYAFRQHVASARRNRKLDMIPEFDQYPIFYFTNHNAIQGPGDVYCMPDHFKNWILSWRLLLLFVRKAEISKQLMPINTLVVI